MTDPNDLDKFRSQAKILLKLNHPNILKVNEVFEDQEYIYVVQEVINGTNLFDFIV